VNVLVQIEIINGFFVIDGNNSREVLKRFGLACVWPLGLEEEGLGVGHRVFGEFLQDEEGFADKLFQVTCLKNEPYRSIRIAANQNVVLGDQKVVHEGSIVFELFVRVPLNPDQFLIPVGINTINRTW